MRRNIFVLFALFPTLLGSASGKAEPEKPRLVTASPAADSECNLSPGDYDYCAVCGPCAKGQGDCDSNSECQAGLSCVDDAGPDYGFGEFVDVCLEVTECPVDPGHVDYCSLCGPCKEGDGDCDSDEQCDQGLKCLADVGDSYGWASNIDVCVQIDCPVPDGDPDYCRLCGPCEEEKGDCDSDDECKDDLTCVTDVGSSYGFSSTTDVCLDVDTDEDDCPVSENHADYCTLCGPCEEGVGDCDSDSECDEGLICVNYTGATDKCMEPIDPDDEDAECPLSKGHADFCRLCGPCAEDVGDCDSDSECETGLTCMPDVGKYYGWDEDVDVCRIPGETDCPELVGSYDFCSVCGDCAEGQGDCDSDDECADGLICVSGVGTQYGFASDVDVCLATCPVPVGHEDYCKMCGPCEEGTGDCDSDDDCADSDAKCMQDVGAIFGFAADVDVCVTGFLCTEPQGSYSYCKVCGPCVEGEGDCDSDSECDTGLACVNEAGPDYGWAWDVDVCLPRKSEECEDLLGKDGYCEKCGPCQKGEGDCDSDDECEDGLFCVNNVGDDYGFDYTIDVCLERDESACDQMREDHDYDYCRLCGPCDAGEGDCDSDAECKIGLECAENVGEEYGLDDQFVDICQVNDECADLIGDEDFCSVCGPCVEGQGDCDGDSECAPGLLCVNNVGAGFGWDWQVDVCLDPGIARDSCPVPPGHYDFCALCGPCDRGEGDCDTSSECAAGLQCVDDLGALFGFKSDVDVCIQP
ncbi:MAG: hypothetical protein EHM61_11585 [Acidobacteria bacterium]|nr:MAG: hypothetical protein EHM61_11585 [Acidobacteriota bacterium]